jgi:hypothetical protein
MFMLKGPERIKASRGFKPPPALLEGLLAVLSLVPLDIRLPDLEEDEVVRKATEEYRGATRSLTRRLKPQPFRPRWQRFKERKLSRGPDPEDLFSKEDWPTFQAKQVAEAKEEFERNSTDFRAAIARKKFCALWRIMLSECSEAFAEYLLDPRVHSGYLAVSGHLSKGDTTAVEAERYRRDRALSLPNDPPKTMTLEQMEPAIARYNQFRLQHKFMRELVTLAASRKATGGRSKITRGFLGSCYIDEHDRFQLEFNPVLQALDDDELEISRIRMCANEKCRRIYWAGNIKQSGCTTKCSAAQNSRNYYRVHVQPKTEREKTRRVLDAIPQGSPITEDALAKETGLSLQDVSRLANKLFEGGQVDCEDLMGQSLYSQKAN